MRRAIVRAFGGLLAVVACTACITPVMAPENLPEAAIAFVHWPGRSGSKRTSILENAAQAAGIPPAHLESERLREREVRAYLRGEVSLRLEAKLVEHPGRLYLYWPRTEVLEPVEAAPPGAIPLAWSDDHRRLLLAAARRDRREQLFEYDLDSRVLRRITSGDDEHPRGDYAEDGGFVVQRVNDFGGRGASENSVHRLGADGRFGPAIARDVPPGTLRYSRVEDRIVYEQVRIREHRSGPAELESMIAARDAVAGAPEEILLRGREPALTPDGEWIVFASASSAGYRLRRMRLDGTARVPISPGGAEERMPSVSPDGTFVVFVQMANGKRTLVVRRFDGKGERALVKDGSSDLPVW
jgi:hypothetical protein